MYHMGLLNTMHFKEMGQEPQHQMTNRKKKATKCKSECNPLQLTEFRT